MSAKTKIVVLQMKEVIYTGIFVVLGVLLILLLIFMFLPKDSRENEVLDTSSYVAGIYTTELVFNNQAISIELVIDQDEIKSIGLVNLNETVTTMYPSFQSTLENIADQIITNQSLENITYPEDSKYTSTMLLEAVKIALDKAVITPTETGNLH